MTKWIWFAVGAVGGFAVGVYITKQAAENKVTTAIHTGLAEFGLAGGQTESVIDKLVIGS